MGWIFSLACADGGKVCARVGHLHHFGWRVRNQWCESDNSNYWHFCNGSTYQNNRMACAKTLPPGGGVQLFRLIHWAYIKRIIAGSASILANGIPA